jgi:hypothetical protein
MHVGTMDIGFIVQAFEFNKRKFILYRTSMAHLEDVEIY